MSAEELKENVRLWMLEDTIVRCSKCGQEKAVNFAQSMRYGWPLHHKLTMVIKSTKADAGKATTEAIKDQLPKH